jgi:DNA-binding transcriptional LysR family regulator
MPSKPTSTRPVNATMRQLRAFLAVAQDASISRAAARLHLTPSALSMLIRSLEGELALRLFDRTTRSVTLTEAGRELQPAIEKMFADLDGAFDGLRHAADRRSGRIRLATSPLLAATLMPQLIASFRERYPDIRMELQDLSVEAIADAVRGGAADLGICTAGGDTTDLAVTVLVQDRLMLACPAGHALAARKEVRWSELAGMAGEAGLVLMKRGSGIRSLADQTFAGLGETVVPDYEVTHVTTAVGLVEAGLGVSILPSYAISRTGAAGVVAVPLAMPAVQRDIVALTPARRSVSAAGDAFLAHFGQEVGGARSAAAPGKKAAKRKA